MNLQFYEKYFFILWVVDGKISAPEKDLPVKFAFKVDNSILVKGNVVPSLKKNKVILHQ